VKILAVDDDRTSLLVVSNLVRKFGHEVVEASDGEEALNKFFFSQPLAVVSDWMMPKMDGLELCRGIRAAGKPFYTYFILLTSKDTSKANFDAAMEAGVDDFLTKPAKSDELRSRLIVAERILRLTKRVADLEGVLPICSYCKRIRREGDSYESLEEYMGSESRVQFSHGICPECMAKHHPDFLRG
jgi:phosphoserine phosphatase RsbU/P